MGLQTVGRLQALQQQNVYIAGAKQAGLDPGFQDPFANLSFLASIPNKLDVYFDLYIASRPHPNTMYAHEGYLLFKQLPAPVRRRSARARCLTMSTSRSAHLTWILETTIIAGRTMRAFSVIR